jgi:hypothetical protein
MDIRKWLGGIAASFQPAYDKIKAWKLSPELDEALDSVWHALSPALQKTIFTYVKSMYDTFGEKIAKEILAAIVKSLQGFFANMGEDD